MAKQSEALQLADALEEKDYPPRRAAAAELRRLHEENERLKAASTAQRQWVGLTDEERRSIREWQKIQEELGPVWAPMMLYLYMAIEAKLKEKNT